MTIQSLCVSFILNVKRLLLCIVQLSMFRYLYIHIYVHKYISIHKYQYTLNVSMQINLIYESFICLLYFLHFSFHTFTVHVHQFSVNLFEIPINVNFKKVCFH